MGNAEEPRPAADSAELFAGGGEMGARMREMDWSRTPLGPVVGWSQSLRTMVKILLANRFPLLLWWGPDQCQLYNDAYRPVLGTKHPRALGQPTRECWTEIWDVIGPLILTPYHGGPATWDDDLFLVVQRHGFAEETHFTVAYSPVPDESAPNGVGGVLATVHEITQQVLQARRVAALRDLGARASEAKTAEEACRIAAEAFGRCPKDVPFALLYLIDPDRQSARLAGAAGVGMGEPASPLTVDMTPGTGDEAAWPLAAVARTETPEVVAPLAGRFGVAPAGPWPVPPHQALVLPIPSNVQRRLAGLLVLGISAYLELDTFYRSFCELATAQVATAIANAQAYEEERRRAEALAELDRAKTAFFSNVSHEFRTPLTLLLGPLEESLARPDGGLAPEERAHLETAHRNALRLLKLVNSLLDFSRIEAGRIQASYEATDLAAATAELASVFRSAIEHAGLRLLVDCPPLSEPVYVDRDMWEKLVLNLLSNAFKHTFAGEIAVTLRQEGAQATLAVRDTGVGIPVAELPHLFERFHRVRDARARTHEGSGIGLALVQELARLHGGAVRVASEEGAGSTFTVTIPLGAAHLPADRVGAARERPTAVGAAPFVEEALRWLPDSARGESLPAEVAVATPHREALAGGRPIRPARILLADDNADMRDYVCRLLSPRHAVEAVADGEAALAAARALPPDLVLADIMMPRLDGFGLLAALRADPATRSLPVILLSARAGEESRVEGLEAGADDYLVKPFAARELLARVDVHLELARTRAEAQAAVEAERQRLRDLFMQAPALIAVLRGPEHVYELANPRYLQLIGGRSADEVLGRPVREVLPEAEAQGLFALLDRVYTTGEPFAADDFPVRLGRRGDGTLDEVSLNFVLQAYHDASGQVAGLLVHAVDVTEHVWARQRLEAEAAERQRAEGMLAGERAVLELIARGRPLRHTLEALIRLIEAESPGVLCSVLLLDRDGRRLRHGAAPSLPDEYNRAIDGIAIGPAAGSCGTAAYHNEPVVVPDIAADPLWADYRDLALPHGLRACWSTPIRGPDGRVLGTFAVYRRAPGEPTPRERAVLDLLTYLAAIAIVRYRAEQERVELLAAERTARAEAEAAVRTRDEFLAAAAHDLKTPLTAVKGTTQLLRRRAARAGGLDAERLADGLASIDGTVTQMAAQIDELLDLARLQAGQGLELRRSPTDLVALARQGAAEQQRGTDRCRIRVDAAEPDLIGDWDEVRLARMLGNLLSNAVKYSPDGGDIVVTVARAASDGEPSVVLAVRDHGIGIPAADLPRVFERFYRAANAAGQAAGTGIGLAGARQIAEQHGGSLVAASVEGEGSTFTVRLPFGERG